MSQHGPVTRFYNRQTDLDGPVSGALHVFHVRLENIANNETDFHTIHIPQGMTFYVTDVYAYCGTVAGDPQITVGKTLAGTQLVASVTLATGENELTVKSTNSVTPLVSANTTGTKEFIDVRIVGDANDTIAEPVSVSVVGHISRPPDSVL